MSTATAQIRSASDVPSLGTILGVWAHPDDEAYLSGGLMALARDAGQRVVCLTATRGELGTTDPWRWPPHRLAVERTAELARCLDILGRPEHRWLDFADGHCAAADPEPVVRRLAELIGEVRPDTVLSFGPDGLTGHSDHQAVGRWTAAAFQRAAPAGARLLQARLPDTWAARWADMSARLGVFEPGHPVLSPADQLVVDLELTGSVLTRKVSALRAQTTQTGVVIEAMGVSTYTEWVSRESFVQAG
jgi:LmbE family N-acetylglucosaminyl deacetylase